MPGIYYIFLLRMIAAFQDFAQVRGQGLEQGTAESPRAVVWRTDMVYGGRSIYVYESSKGESEEAQGETGWVWDSQRRRRQQREKQELVGRGSRRDTCMCVERARGWKVREQDECARISNLCWGLQWKIETSAQGGYVCVCEFSLWHVPCPSFPLWSS